MWILTNCTFPRRLLLSCSTREKWPHQFLLIINKWLRIVRLKVNRDQQNSSSSENPPIHSPWPFSMTPSAKWNYANNNWHCRVSLRQGYHYKLCYCILTLSKRNVKWAPCQFLRLKFVVLDFYIVHVLLNKQRVKNKKPCENEVRSRLRWIRGWTKAKDLKCF